MPKNKNKRKNGNKVDPKPQTSFNNLVAEATDHALKNTIFQEIQQLGYKLAQNQSREMAGLVTRLTAIEQIVCEEFKIDPTVLANRVADIEDTATDYEVVEKSENGDLLRLTISTKPSSEKEYGEESKLQVISLNQGNYTLPKEIEEALVGVTIGQVLEVPFGKEGEHRAKIIVDRISRQIKEETNEESKSTEG